MPISNHYETLGIRRTAQIEEIELAYRGRRSQYHPDRYTASDAATIQWATEQMQHVNAAYATLSDVSKRRQYDAESQNISRGSPDKSSTRPPQPPMTLAEYLNACGVKDITSDSIFFHPNIPAKKLAGAKSGYASGVAQDEVLILIDDTVFGSGKDGSVVTSDRLLFKEKFQTGIAFKLADIHQIACDENTVTINGQTIGSFTLADKLAAGYVFHVISNYLTALTQIQSVMACPPGPPPGMDTRLMEHVLRRYTVPVALKQGKDLSQFGGRYPGYHIGHQIPQALERMVRFTLGIPECDQMLAVIDLWDGQGEAVAFTNRGVYSRCRASNSVTAYEWWTLGGRSVVDEFELSVFEGVVFDDGRRLICGRKNVVLKPFGASLFADLFKVLTNRDGTGTDFTADADQNDSDEVDPVWLHQQLEEGFEVARNEFAETYELLQQSLGEHAHHVGKLAMSFFKDVHQSILGDCYTLDELTALRDVQFLSRNITAVLRRTAMPDADLYQNAEDDIELIQLLKLILSSMHEEFRDARSDAHNASEYFHRRR